MNKVLIINPFGIGDVLFSTPMIATLKEEFPGVSISYLGNARTAPILKNDPRIDDVLSYERDEFVAVYRKSPWQFFLKWRGLIEKIRAGRFDVAFDLSMGSPLSFGLFLAGVPKRIGFNYKGRGRWLTHSISLKGYEGRHVAEYHADLLGFVGIHDAPGAMSCFPSSKEEAWADGVLRDNGLRPGQFIVLYPGGGASWGKGAFQKRWSPENYAKLADKIIEKATLAIILLGDQNEIELCRAVLNAVEQKTGGKKVISLAGRTSVLEAAALMHRARFVIANDGGPLHMAVAAGGRTVSIFGPVDPTVYGPFLRGSHKVVTLGLPCQPCYRNFRMSDCKHQTCLKQLTVSEVYQQLEEWL
jgi:lipopolysaccharide heptosyltransferase II